MKNEWTQEDEASLQEMMARKESILLVQRTALENVIKDTVIFDRYGEFDEVVDFFVENAAELCAVLKPFVPEEAP